jgi:hypothetical protein
VTGCSNMAGATNSEQQMQSCMNDGRSSEQIMVDMIREDLGVTINPQAWRIFVRHRFSRISPLAHRIHDGKR